MKRLVLGMIGGYQRVFAHRPSPCRFVPTCSHFAAEAVETHGTARGLVLSARRIARCRPGGPQGWDPVPGRPPSAGSED